MSKAFMINGIPMESPTDCQWQLADLSSDESGRSTRNGAMSKDIIAQKRTLTFTWGILAWTEASRLANYCKNKGAVVTLTYPDIMSGTYITKRFYTGNMTANYDIKKYDQIYVKNASCSFVEM